MDLIFSIKTSLILGTFLLAQSQALTCQPPKTEAISIYDDSFSIDEGIYFINVSRCVQCDCKIKDDYPVPATTKTVKVIVHDVFDPNEYVEISIYNHTSCKCGTKKERDSKLYGPRRKVDLAYTNANIQNNPRQLKGSIPHSRYMLTEDDYAPRYYVKKQCVPMCPSVHQVKRSLTIVHKSTYRKKLEYWDDTQCDCNKFNGVTTRKIPKDSILQLSAGKAVYVAVLLAMVLIIILLMDFCFFCRKKGFCYTLTSCKKQENEDCPNCQELQV